MACTPVLSSYLINKLLLVLTNEGTFTPPATVYLALYTTNPTPMNTGAEVTGGGYARQLVTWTSVGSGLSAQNNGVITFPVASANYGTVTYLALFDAPTGGNLLMFTPATTPQAVNAGSAYQVNSGNLNIAFQ